MASASTLFWRFFQHTLTFKSQALISAGLVVVQPLLTIGLLWTGKQLVDDVLMSGKVGALAILGPLAAVIIAARIGAEYLTQVVEAGVVQGIAQSLRDRLYHHIMSVSPGSLGSETTGITLSRLQSNTEQTEYLIFTGPIAIAADSMAASSFCIALFALSWHLALITLLTLPGIVWFSWRYAPYVRRAARQSQRAEAHWMSLAEERLEAQPMVQAFQGEGLEIQAFQHRTGRARDSEVRTISLMARQALLIEAVASIGGLAVIGAGVHLIESGIMTTGTLLAFFGALGSAFAPVRALAKASGRIQQAAAGAQRVVDILDLPSRVTERPGAKALAMPRGKIEFRNVSFAYPGADPVLLGVSFVVEPGETVALVGPSGSGKSSLIRLLLRFYDPDDGQVLVDGIDVRDLTLASLRSTVAAVFQEPYIVSGSIVENIRRVTPGVAAGKVAAAASAAAVDAFTDPLPGGLMSAAGPRGTNLSGGQRQRIALARALVKEAPVLVLDEATAAVDGETEDIIHAAIAKAGRKMTTLIVAHRLSSVRHADRVIVLDQGRIVECGSPADLFAGPSRARELFASQVSTSRLAA